MSLFNFSFFFVLYSTEELQSLSEYRTSLIQWVSENKQLNKGNIWIMNFYLFAIQMPANSSFSSHNLKSKVKVCYSSYQSRNLSVKHPMTWIMVIWKQDWKKPVYGPKSLVFKWSAKTCDFTIWIPDTCTVQNSDKSGAQAEMRVPKWLLTWLSKYFGVWSPVSRENKGDIILPRWRFHL